MNLIRQVTIRSRSGTELDRVERANVWARNDALYNLPDSYLKKFGLVQGFGALRSQADSPNTNSATKTRFCIPLTRLAPFFRPLKKGMKLPPQLASGLQIQIIGKILKPLSQLLLVVLVQPVDMKFQICKLCVILLL
jgi:hypothetical protein